MMKEIACKGGIINFRIPTTWKEEYSKGGGIYYEQGDDVNTLRLNVTTAKNNKDILNLEEFARVMKPESTDIERLSNGNVLKKCVIISNERGKSLKTYSWMLFNSIPPHTLRIANFTFTTFESLSSDEAVVSKFNMLEKEIKEAVFINLTIEQVQQSNNARKKAWWKIW